MRESRHGSRPSSTVAFYEVCGNICVPERTVIVNCYEYDETAPENIRNQWRDSWLKVCLTHFLAMGVDNGRHKINVYANKWNTATGNRGGPTLFNSQ